ncbi:MAG TPA: PaaI family thioesterase [Rugosimonospora sp.]|nr:PaaI family thioesterase [Rugosimonospora sp.]
MTELAGFQFTDLPTAKVDRMESYLGPLADSVRALVDATIRTTVPAAQVRRARVEIEAVTARLRARQLPGPAGIHVNAEGRSWQWGNAAVGLRNAVAPPLVVRRDEDGVVRGWAVLGAAYEGPPGMVHGGALALLLDHLMGVTASHGRRPAVTGTLTLRYRHATPLGLVRLEGRIDRREGVKTIVSAHISDGSASTVDAEGIFILPHWARDAHRMAEPQ